MPQPGDRVRITGHMQDPDPLPIGTEGTVAFVLNQHTRDEQVVVDWDIPRSLMLLPHDPYVVIGRAPRV